MSWTTFIYFAIPAVILWAAGAYLSFRDKRNTAVVITFLGLLVFGAYIAGMWISLERPPLRTMGETRLWYSFFLPDAGLITNVGKAHLLGFGSFDGVRRTKGELYDYLKASSGTALYNSGNPILVDMINERKGLKIIPYGAELAGTLILPSSPENPFLSMKIEGGRVIKTNMIGSYNSDNVLAALAAGALFEVDKEEAVNAIEDYYPSNNRSHLTKG